MWTLTQYTARGGGDHLGRRMPQNFFDCAVFVEFHERPKAFQIASRALLLRLLHRAQMLIDELFSQLLVIRLAFKRFLGSPQPPPCASLRLVGLSSASVAAAKNARAIISKEFLMSILTEASEMLAEILPLFKPSVSWSSAVSPDKLSCQPHKELELAASFPSIGACEKSAPHAWRSAEPQHDRGAYPVLPGFGSGERNLQAWGGRR
jgi:hypothetical protein